MKAEENSAEQAAAADSGANEDSSPLLPDTALIDPLVVPEKIDQ